MIEWTSYGWTFLIYKVENQEKVAKLVENLEIINEVFTKEVAKSIKKPGTENSNIDFSTTRLTPPSTALYTKHL